MLGWIGYTQRSNVSVPDGGRGQNICDGLGGDGRYNQSRESDLIAIHSGGVIGDIGAHVIKRTRCQAGHGAGEGPDCADRAIRGFAVRGGRVGRCAPDDAMLGWIWYTQGGDGSVPGGGGGGDIRHGLRGDRRREQRGESDILAIHGAYIIGGIGAHVVQGTRRQVGDGAGERHLAR